MERRYTYCNTSIALGLFVLIFGLLSRGVSAQQRCDVSIFFEEGISHVDTLYMDNAASLDHLTLLLDTITHDPYASLDHLEISGLTSPEGGARYNYRLAGARAQQAHDFFSQHNATRHSTFRLTPYGTDWAQLLELVGDDRQMPRRNEVMEIIRQMPDTHADSSLVAAPSFEASDRLLAKLRYLGGGAPWRYMDAKLFPAMRQAKIIAWYKRQYPRLGDPTAIALPYVEPLPSVSPETIALQLDRYERRPLFALKTNLLFDALTVLNAEIEVPLGKRWSIAGEWIFPWWTIDDDTPTSPRHRLQLLNGNLEGKLWFGDRTNRPLMTGWFAGVYLGGGLYDFEYSTKGYQGEFFILGGLSAGYAHTINRRGNLRMEYSAGFGYLETDYRYYEAVFDPDLVTDIPEKHNWHPIKEKVGTFSWLGPTKLKVSLVWMLDYKRKL